MIQERTKKSLELISPIFEQDDEEKHYLDQADCLLVPNEDVIDEEWIANVLGES